MKSVAVIGGGAAGCFFAVNLKRACPDADVHVWESGKKILSKLALTGGGRCNITNTFSTRDNLSEIYPRGKNLMKKVLHSFGPDDTLKWFGDEGVDFYEQAEDGCVFPTSDDAMQIVGILSDALRRCGVEVHCDCPVSGIVRDGNGFAFVAGGKLRRADIVAYMPGGGALQAISGLGLKIQTPVPALYSLNIRNEELNALAGCVVPTVRLSIPGTSFKSEGTLLLADWGISGPATLNLSSYAARHLFDKGFNCPLTINWTAQGEEEVSAQLHRIGEGNGGRLVSGIHPEEFSSRLWEYLLDRADIRSDMRWGELGKKGFNRIVNTLVADSYEIQGKCRFKAAFVKCGGVDLGEIDPSTMECRSVPGLYFAGEVMDVDAITGGFNLQCAWSTSVIAARSVQQALG